MTEPTDEEQNRQQRIAAEEILLQFVAYPSQRQRLVDQGYWVWSETHEIFNDIYVLSQHGDVIFEAPHTTVFKVLAKRSETFAQSSMGVHRDKP